MFKKSMIICCIHWVVTIIAQKVIRVGEQRHFLTDSKKHDTYLANHLSCQSAILPPFPLTAIMPIINYSYQPPWPISHHAPLDLVPNGHYVYRLSDLLSRLLSHFGLLQRDSNFGHLNASKATSKSLLNMLNQCTSERVLKVLHYFILKNKRDL